MSVIGELYTESRFTWKVGACYKLNWAGVDPPELQFEATIGQQGIIGGRRSIETFVKRQASFERTR